MDRVVLAGAILLTTIIPFGIASRAVEPEIVTVERELLPEAAEYVPDNRLGQRRIEVFGYCMANTNPGPGLSRELVICRGEMSRHNPLHDLAFACEDPELYAKALLLTDRLVRIVGVELERGGVRLLLVEQISALK